MTCLVDIKAHLRRRLNGSVKSFRIRCELSNDGFLIRLEKGQFGPRGAFRPEHVRLPSSSLDRLKARYHRHSGHLHMHDASSPIASNAMHYALLTSSPKFLTIPLG